jgi:hypothetical protein
MPMASATRSVRRRPGTNGPNTPFVRRAACTIALVACAHDAAAVGYCMDKRIGNTEGLGGVFALLKGIGKPLPFPEAQRLYTPSLRFEAFERIAKAGEALGYGPGADAPSSKREML